MKTSLKSILIVPLLIFFSTEVMGQYMLGISYEKRSDEPTNGLGIQFQNNFSPIPLLSLSARFQASYYNEKYSLTQNATTFERTDTSYDLGIGLVAGVNVGLVAPYAGVGIGMEFFNREETIAGGVSSSGDDSGFFYYGLVGVGVSIIPVLRPFVEYRYRGITKSDFMPSEHGTWAFGVAIRF